MYSKNRLATRFSLAIALSMMQPALTAHIPIAPPPDTSMRTSPRYPLNDALRLSVRDIHRSYANTMRLCSLRLTSGGLETVEALITRRDSLDGTENEVWKTDAGDNSQLASGINVPP